MDGNYDVLNSMSVDNLDGIYVLGSFARHVTIHAQQRRALNLIWALFQSGRLTKDSQIGIVGAGFAGLTAAIAANQHGAKVTIIEKEQIYLPLQHGNHTRYLHPNIYDWPFPGSNKETTELPFMNWKAGISAEVAKKVLEEWSLIKGPIIEKPGHQIRLVSVRSGRPLVSFIRPGLGYQEFDCVIMAVGFGLERSLEFVTPRSYWHDDALHQQEIRQTSGARSFLVSGCGDGGLIDVCRLALSGFDHEDFTNWLLADPTVAEIGKLLLPIEMKAKRFSNVETVGELLLEQYSSLPSALLGDISGKLKSKIRSNDAITLNGPRLSPLELRASALNRFLVFLLLRNGWIRYQDGKIRIEGGPGPGTFVRFDSPRSPASAVYFDVVVVRHGPQSIVQHLLPEAKCEAVEDLMRRQSDRTKDRLWGEFYHAQSGTAKALPSGPTRQHVLEHLADAARELVKMAKGESISIGEDAGFYYRIMFPESEGNQLDRPLEYKGVPVRYIPMTEVIRPTSGRGVTIELSDLYCGSPLLNKTVLETIGRQDGQEVSCCLGCYVRTREGALALITVAHPLVTNGGKPGDEVATWSSDPRAPAAVARLATFESIAQSGEGASGTLDVALAVVNSTVRASQQFHPRYSQFLPQGFRISGVTDPSIGASVMKIGWATGLTFGVIESTVATIGVHYEDGKVHYFENVFLIKRVNDVAFVGPGDSGSLVINPEGRAVGMNFAGNKDFAVAFPIGAALSALNCNII